MATKDYTLFLQEARKFLPEERIYTDELRRLAWGTDAGFYRLIPQLIIRSDSEEEVTRLLKLADRYQLPVTFRAAGDQFVGTSHQRFDTDCCRKELGELLYIPRPFPDNLTTRHHRPAGQ